MASVTKSFTAAAQVSTSLFVKHGDSFTVSITGTFVATLILERTLNGGQGWDQVASYTTTASPTILVETRTGKPASYRLRCSSYTSGTAVTTLTDYASESLVSSFDQAHNASLVGTVPQPTTGSISAAIERMGKFFTLTFTLTAAQVAVTDGAASGSYGALQLFDFVEGSILFLGCRQNYTAYAEGAALTGNAGDAAFKIGVGTTAISAAADAVLATANKNVGGEISQTLSGGTTTGTAHTASSAAVDGTSTANDLYLNWSGSAATIDANSTIDVTGTVTVVGVFLGDD